MIMILLHSLQSYLMIRFSLSRKKRTNSINVNDKNNLIGERKKQQQVYRWRSVQNRLEYSVTVYWLVIFISKWNRKVLSFYFLIKLNFFLSFSAPGFLLLLYLCIGLYEEIYSGIFLFRFLSESEREREKSESQRFFSSWTKKKTETVQSELIFVRAFQLRIELKIALELYHIRYNYPEVLNLITGFWLTTVVGIIDDEEEERKTAE